MQEYDMHKLMQKDEFQFRIGQFSYKVRIKGYSFPVRIRSLARYVQGELHMHKKKRIEWLRLKQSHSGGLKPSNNSKCLFIEPIHF